MDKEYGFNDERLKSFRKEIITAVTKHIIEGDKEELSARLTDVVYVLSSTLALPIEFLRLMGMEKDGIEKGLTLITNTIRKSAEEKDSPTAKLAQSLIAKFSPLFKDVKVDGLSFTKIEEISKEEVANHPPKAITELASWVAKEVFKTLLKEGFDVGQGAIGTVHFQKDKDEKMQFLNLRVNFTRKEGGNERNIT